MLASVNHTGTRPTAGRATVMALNPQHHRRHCWPAVRLSWFCSFNSTTTTGGRHTNTPKKIYASYVLCYETLFYFPQSSLGEVGRAHPARKIKDQPLRLYSEKSISRALFSIQKNQDFIVKQDQPLSLLFVLLFLQASCLAQTTESAYVRPVPLQCFGYHGVAGIKKGP
jgi:hypothetical protein